MKTLTSLECMYKTIDKLALQPDFPHGYCNIASKELLALLQEQKKDVRLQFTYAEQGDGHAFVVEKLDNGEEIILDPTYAQYDQDYQGQGFVGKHFPDALLEQNRLEADAFLEKQRRWYQEGIYDS